MLTTETLSEAITECERFLARAKQLQRETAMAVKKRANKQKEIDAGQAPEWELWHILNPIGGSTLSGSVKRASMDLTRTLAKLRSRS